MSARPLRASIQARLRLGVGALVAALALLSALAVLSIGRLGGAVETILRENYASVILCEQMKESLERQDSAALFAATGREDIAAPMLAAHRQSFAAALADEQSNITVPGEGDLVREITALDREYLAEVDRALALPRDARQGAYFRELLPRFERLKDRVQAVLRLNQESMEQADRATKSLARRTVQGAVLVSALAMLFAAWFLIRLPRVVVRPVEELTRSALAVGEGDLDVAVVESEVAELAALAAAFNRMTARLRAYRESSLGELLAAKDLANTTLECMLDPVIVFAKDGGAPLVNAAAEEAFGVSAGTATELASAPRRIPPEIAAARDRIFATGEPVLPRALSEAMRWRAEGGERSYLVRAAPLRPQPGEPPGAIVVAQDVTRFRRIDELKSDVVATVSHEFKTPLTSLRMATHLLLEPSTGPLGEAQRELVTTARDDTERLRAMVEDLLDVVRIESEAGALHRVPVDPLGLLCEVADAHRSVARDKGVTIELAKTPAAGLFPVDPERIAIALANLVSNAIRHTPPGGRVTLAATREGGALRFEVSDTGEGIAPEELARILERAPAAGGTESARRHGLGLTIAREIVRQHGGELAAERAPGGGSVFALTLPEG